MYFVDSWDANDEFIVLYDDTNELLRTNSNPTIGNVCGSGSWPERGFSDRIASIASHQAHTLKLVFRGNLDEDESNESFGFNNIVISLKLCYPTCDYCDGPLYTDCTACTGTLYLWYGQCLNPCPDGWYAATTTNECLPCHSSVVNPLSCTTCNGPNSNNCLTCGPNSYLQVSTSTCISACPTIAWYGDTADWTCKPCYVNTGSNPYSCETCNGPSATNCATCYAGKYLYPPNGNCLKPCPDGWWGDDTVWRCKPCYGVYSLMPGTRQGCRTCFGPLSTSCKTCNDGIYYFSIDNSCLYTCPDGYYSTEQPYPNNLCNQCYQHNPPTNPDGTCATCTGGFSNECLSCNHGWFFDSTTKKCVTTCPIGWWGDEVNNVCQQCYQAPLTTSHEQTCYTCSKGTVRDCTSCSGNSFFYAPYQSCLLTCPTGWWGEIATNTCKQCYQYNSASPMENACMTCNGGNSNNCLSCSTGLFLDTTTNTCVGTCPDGYWGDTTNNTCKPCYISPNPATDISKGCKTCFGPTQIECSSCNSGNFLHSVNSSCLSSCPDGWYANPASDSCDPCYTTSATSGYLSCATCNGPNYNNCLSCNREEIVSALLFVPLSTCVDACPAGWFPNYTTEACQQCYQATLPSQQNRTCATCTDSLSTSCLSCLPGEYLMSTTSTCLTSCPKYGWYPRSDTNICGKCYQPTDIEVERECITCSGPFATNCTKCAEGHYLHLVNNTCLQRCPDGFFTNLTTATCVSCFVSQNSSNNNTCATCDGPLPSDCLSCYPPLVYFASTKSCEPICPCQGGYYFDAVNNVCGTCSPKCDRCTGPGDNDCDYSDEIDYSCLSGETYSQQSDIFDIFGPVIAIISTLSQMVSIVSIVASGASILEASVSLTLLGSLELYQFLNVNYPSNVLLFFKYFFSSLLGAFPNLFLFVCNPEPAVVHKESRVQGSDKVGLFGMSNLFLKNFGGQLSLLLALMACAGLLNIIVFVIAKLGMITPIQEGTKQIKDFFQWNLIISVFIASFVQMSLSAFLQLGYTTKVEHWFSLYSYSLAVVGLLALVISLVLLFVYGVFQRVPNQKNSEFNNQLRILTDYHVGTESNHDKRRYFAFVFCTRIFLLVAFISTLSQSPIVQCLMAIAINGAYFIIIARWQFLKRGIQQQLFRCCEGLNALIPMIFLLYGINDWDKKFLGNGDTRVILGWFIITFITLITVITCFLQLFDGFYVMKRFGPWLKRLVMSIKNFVTGEDIFYSHQKEKDRITQKKRSEGKLKRDLKIIHFDMLEMERKENKSRQSMILTEIDLDKPSVELKDPDDSVTYLKPIIIHQPSEFRANEQILITKEASEGSANKSESQLPKLPGQPDFIETSSEAFGIGKKEYYIDALSKYLEKTHLQENEDKILKQSISES